MERKSVVNYFFSLFYFTFIFWLLGADGPVDTLYDGIYSSLTQEVQGRLPSEYRWSVVQIVLYFVLSVIGLFALYHYENRYAPRRWQYFLPEFYDEVISFGQRYFNERLHEFEKGSLVGLLGQTAAHDHAIRDCLDALRDALIHGYRSDDIRITLMYPTKMRTSESEEEADDPVRLYVKYWANEARTPPITYKQGLGFDRGEGFAGWAWKTGRVQIGGTRRWNLIKDKRFAYKTPGHDGVKTFCSIPIYDEGPSINSNPITAVLNIDATKRLYFPFSSRRQRAFARALRPFLVVIAFHFGAIRKLESRRN